MERDLRNEWSAGSDAIEDFSIELDDGALEALLTPGRVVDPDEGTVVPSDELLVVTRRISLQFLDVLHVTAGSLFAGRDLRASAAQLVTALDALERLAKAAGDEAQLGLLAEIRPLATEFSTSTGARVRERFLSKLRAWVVRFAEHLGEEEGARFRALVTYDARAIPLFAELAALRGIGPRRLQRLFSAGLHSVEVVGGSDPLEVAQVTGLPRALAADVVQRARVFREEHRRRTVVEMRTRIAEFQRVLDGLDAGAHPELWQMARSAAAEMRWVVARLQQEGEG